MRGKVGEVIEAFVKGEAEPSKSRTGSIFFEGNALYSYGYHYPMAYRMETEEGIRFLCNGRSSTATTNKQRRQFICLAHLTNSPQDLVKMVGQEHIEQAIRQKADSVVVLHEMVAPMNDEHLKIIMRDFYRNKGATSQKVTAEVNKFTEHMAKILLLSGGKSE